MRVVYANSQKLTKPLGDTVKCWRCGEDHPVEPSLEEEGSILAYMECGGKSFLCGVKGMEWRPK